LEDIPEEVSAYLDNVDIVVEQYPTREQLLGSLIKDDEYLMGLYEGLPLTERAEYGAVLPDKITIFQNSIEHFCTSDKEIMEEVRKTIVHEVGHHFGMSDKRLEELGY